MCHHNGFSVMPCDARLRRGRRAGVPRWHARGQGFKSPQLHQAQRHFHSRSERRLPAIRQQMTQSDCLYADVTRAASRGRLPPLPGRRLGAPRPQPPLGRPSPGWCAGSGPPVALPGCRPTRPLAWWPIGSSMTRAGMPASSSQVEKVCRRSCGPRRSKWPRSAPAASTAAL